MSLWNKINDDLKQVMLAKDTLRISVLRMIKSKIMLVDTKGNLEDQEVLKIITKYSRDLKEAITQAKAVGRNDVADTTEKELKIVGEYLPPEMSDEEIETLVKDVVVRIGATSIKEMGKVMKEIMSLNSTLDGTKVKTFAQKMLSV